MAHADKQLGTVQGAATVAADLGRVAGPAKAAIHQHIYGGGDPARVARHAQREQERAIRIARAGALHDLRSWS
ncbi:hypothetical protein [Xanthobacter sediminis]